MSQEKGPGTMEKQLHKFKVMYDLALNMSSEKSLDENLTYIVEQSRALLNADTAYIALADDERKEVYMNTLSGIRTEAFRQLRIPFGMGLGGKVMTTRQGYIVKDYLKDREITHIIDPIIQEEGVSSGMAVPIQFGANSLGVLYVFNRRPTHFNADDLDTLSLLGNLAAVEIARQRAEIALRRAHDELDSRVTERTAELARSTEELKNEVVERRRAEGELRASEEKYRTIIENMEEGYYEIDLAGRFMFINDASARILGIPKERLLGVHYRDYASEESAKNIFKTFNEIYRTGKTAKIVDYEIRQPDGIYRYLELSASLIADSGGQPAGFRGVVRDITERRRMEDVLRESEEKFAKAFLQNSIPMTITTIADGRYINVSEKFLEMMGMTRDEVIGNTSVGIGFITGEQRSLLIDELNEKGRVENFELPMRTQGESLHYGLFNSTRIRLANEDHLLTVITDITARKQVEDALRESEERLQVVFDSVHDFIFIKDAERRYVMVNQFFYSRFQIDSSVFIGKRDSEVVVFENRKETADLIEDSDTRVLQGESIGYEIDHLVCGVMMTFDIIKTPIRDKDGRITSICGLSRDITERKRLNEERRRLEERLQRAQKMEALGTLAGGVAHDLNNVLGVLVGYSELLLMNIPEDSPLRRHVVNINQSGEKGAAIIQDLLTLARRGVAVSEVVNLNKIVSDYFQAPEFEKLKAYYPNVTFATDLERELMNINGSPVHLGKTVMNLVINAAEAIPDRGVVIVTTENRYLDKDVRRYDDMAEGDYVVLTVSDNGRGISEKDIGKIFEPFYTKKVMGRSGTGLGLAVVWGTVKDHDGYIDVESEEGKGSVFTIYFPITREKQARSPKVVLPETYHGRGERILIVDDMQKQRELAVDMLSAIGYMTDAVASGEEAVEYLKERNADLVVLDMIMDPGIDGLETYERILLINPVQKAIIVSGYSETERVKKAQDLGAGAYVRKPYILEKIGLAIRKELDRS
jgi:two-component system, cell cycle sensor histidine kinase and response regulator CckA